MKKTVLTLAALIMLTACGMTKKDLGLQKQSPDPATAKTQEELVVPPNYDLVPVVPQK
ncbi:MAG: hypothetical protein IJ689_01115 [Alphaproteobacteria bacterium]|nr:hypothetical protein [Alphaproteobacteria bacterium]